MNSVHHDKHVEAPDSKQDVEKDGVSFDALSKVFLFSRKYGGEKASND
jgi:hypothetical protein